MKSNKEIIYDFIEDYTNSMINEDIKGVSTQYLSQRLGMQRTNISSILNALVKEGSIEKINGRPVLYRTRQENISYKTDFSCFSNLIGYDSSLKGAVQLAKAAILYPKHSLHSLIIGPKGSGKSFFASLMYQFALENKIIKEHAPYIKFNCKNYSDNPEKMVEELFGIGNEYNPNTYIEQSKNGVLFIDHVELLPASARKLLFHLVENNSLLQFGKERNLNVIIVCAINDNTNKAIMETYTTYFSVKISLPSLETRTFEERFKIIQHFFSIEAISISKRLIINSELLTCLLLYHCETNIKQLKNDIKLGCANGYVRQFNNDKGEIKILMSDFLYYVRNGFLNYKNYRKEIDEIIPEDYSYTFSNQNIEMSKIAVQKQSNRNIYEYVDERAEELRERGIPEQDINMIVSIDIENEFNKYKQNLSMQVVNKEQLSKVVNNKIITMVGTFLDDAANLFHKVYPVSVFYGLCLHLNSTIENTNKTQKLSNDQIMEIIEKYKSEYAFCMSFASKVEKEFNLRLPIDEVIFITMFLCNKSMDDINEKRPVALVAMHGSNTASSIVEVINTIGGVKAYAYDMSLDKNSREAYEELKNIVININRGKGVLVIYDMGSFKNMLEMIENETYIPIRLIEIPITLLALECARKTLMESNIDIIHENLVDSYKNMSFLNEPLYHHKEAKKVIITLCMSGEGGAIQLKKYIEKSIELIDTEIIALAISDHEYLVNEVNKIRESHHIVCLVGTYDPQLYGIPFVAISSVFNHGDKSLAKILNLQEKIVLENNEHYKMVFEHLREELEYVDGEFIEKELLEFLNDLDEYLNYELALDQKMGLLVHIACCVDNMIGKLEMPTNLYTSEIISKNQELYYYLKDRFVVLEREFKVVFQDDEIANVISIIKKLRRG